MFTEYNKHYITVDGSGCIINGFSDAFKEPEASDICINDTAGYQFRLFPNGEENPRLHHNRYFVPLYKYESGVIKRRTNSEIQSDIDEIKSRIAANMKPNRLDVLEAQTTYTAMMTDTLLLEATPAPMADESFMYAKIKKWYDQGLWTASMVQNSVVKNLITSEECNEIIGNIQ